MTLRFDESKCNVGSKLVPYLRWWMGLWNPWWQQELPLPPFGPQLSTTRDVLVINKVDHLKGFLITLGPCGGHAAPSLVYFFFFWKFVFTKKNWSTNLLPWSLGRWPLWYTPNSETTRPTCEPPRRLVQTSWPGYSAKVKTLRWWAGMKKIVGTGVVLWSCPTHVVGWYPTYHWSWGGWEWGGRIRLR